MPTFSIDPHRLEELLNYCTGFAKQMIEGHSEFYPFGAVIASNGKLTAVVDILAISTRKVQKFIVCFKIP
jgi:hypothetical protein